MYLIIILLIFSIFSKTSKISKTTSATTSKTTSAATSKTEELLCYKRSSKLNLYRIKTSNIIKIISNESLLEECVDYNNITKYYILYENFEDYKILFSRIANAETLVDIINNNNSSNVIDMIGNVLFGGPNFNTDFGNVNPFSNFITKELLNKLTFQNKEPILDYGISKFGGFNKKSVMIHDALTEMDNNNDDNNNRRALASTTTADDYDNVGLLIFNIIMNRTKREQFKKNFYEPVQKELIGLGDTYKKIYRVSSSIIMNIINNKTLIERGADVVWDFWNADFEILWLMSKNPTLRRFTFSSYKTVMSDLKEIMIYQKNLFWAYDKVYEFSISDTKYHHVQQMVLPEYGSGETRDSWSIVDFFDLDYWNPQKSWFTGFHPDDRRILRPSGFLSFPLGGVMFLVSSVVFPPIMPIANVLSFLPIVINIPIPSDSFALIGWGAVWFFRWSVFLKYNVTNVERWGEPNEALCETGFPYLPDPRYYECQPPLFEQAVGFIPSDLSTSDVDLLFCLQWIDPFSQIIGFMQIVLSPTLGDNEKLLPFFIFFEERLGIQLVKKDIPWQQGACLVGKLPFIIIIGGAIMLLGIVPIIVFCIYELRIVLTEDSTISNEINDKQLKSSVVQNKNSIEDLIKLMIVKKNNNDRKKRKKK